MVDGEDDRVALVERHDFGPGLHARSLLRQHELAAAEILARPRQQDRDLERKRQFPIQVLVEAVVVTRAILQQERRRTPLSRRMASLDERGVVGRVARREAHAGIPAVGHTHQPRIKRVP
jgi:hypothetical protein